MDFDTFLASLDPIPADAPVVFLTEQGEILGGYHVTEFKHHQITGIDCGARTSTWTQTSMQLLDGGDQQHMNVEKFSTILRQSIEKVEGLGTGEAYVEFANNNDGMRIYNILLPKLVENRLLVQLEPIYAECKPANLFEAGCGPSNCCSSKPATNGYCG